MSTITVCYAVKGGSGTTVVAAAMTLAARVEVDLVDLDGQQPAALGIPEPGGDGIAEWMTAGVDASAADLLTVRISDSTRLLPRGHTPLDRHGSRWAELAAWLRQRSGLVIVDAGTGRPPAPLVEAADRTLLITRPCYLALRLAAASPVRPTGIVLVNEPGRALTAGDVARATGAPVVAEVAYDAAVARAVDAGLLATRLPGTLRASLQPAVATAETSPGATSDFTPLGTLRRIVERGRAAGGHEPPPLDVA